MVATARTFLVSVLIAGAAIVGTSARADDPAASDFRWCTFLGGQGEDLLYTPHDLLIEARGWVVGAGMTDSTDFPCLNGFDETYNGGDDDVFVMVMDAGRHGEAQLLYSTYLGGADVDLAKAVVVTPDGLVIVAGSTASADFPTTENAFDPSFNGGEYDGFVAVLRPLGEGEIGQLVYSTFIGGTGYDWINELVLAADGTVIIGGGTDSPDFPTTPGALDETYNGGYDGWVAVLDFDTPADAMPLCTYLGGANHDWVNHLAVDGVGAIVASGRTASADFPTTPGAYDRTYNGGAWDGFVARLHPSLDSLRASTFLGGVHIDAARAMTLAPDGDVLVAGWTRSVDYPTTPGVFDVTHRGGWDGFVTRLDKALTQVRASTLLGTSGLDGVTSIAVDDRGGVNVVGWTDDADYPVTDGAEHASYCGGELDSFVTRLDADLVVIEYSSFIGGSDDDFSLQVAPSGPGEITFGGMTRSADFGTTDDAYDRTINGDGDVFLVTLDYCPADLDHSGAVDVADLLQLLGTWGQVGVDGDFDGDGVGVTDFFAMLAHWGPCS